MRIDTRTSQRLALAAVISGYSKAEIVCVAIDEYIENRDDLKAKLGKALEEPVLGTYRAEKTGGKQV